MTEHNKTGLMLKASVRILAAVPMLMLLFFLPAGTFDYWQAWVYLVVLITLVAIAAVYLRKNDPELLKRRLESREKNADQSRIIKVSSLALLLIFILPGLDHRFGWSQVPPVVVIIAVILVILSYGFILLAWRENSYAARTVKVEEGQKVINNGPYALVRHPMYLGLMVFLHPFSAGSGLVVGSHTRSAHHTHSRRAYCPRRTTTGKGSGGIHRLHEINPIQVNSRYKLTRFYPAVSCANE